MSACMCVCMGVSNMPVCMYVCTYVRLMCACVFVKRALPSFSCDLMFRCVCAYVFMCLLCLCVYACMCICVYVWGALRQMKHKGIYT